MHTPDVMSPPLGFPPSSPLKLYPHEFRAIASPNPFEDESGVMLIIRALDSIIQCDLISFRTYREIEGPYCDYIASQFEKPVLLTVLYCSFGSECALKKDQFQELVLGLELTGKPFLVALKPPLGSATVEEALPDGFEERVRGRGIVHGGWVQQPQILAHPSIGCFLSHCGYGSMLESLLMNDFQIVLIPNVLDQYLNAKLLTEELKVAVTVERREEDGWFSKENVCSAVKTVMDEGSRIGVELKANHAKLKKLLSDPDLESSYIDTFTNKLLDLM
ncbi:UDP-glucuronosyl/UDP-glucosyltransferase [Macleaya cordata]|uniref:UDP-glucuronosyl/UDP-glucosyltransferase n=1 Tax=Macleaya cordata TaxID=56857 RepID=A0A200QK23_MACCD|nr:UDP-glucuronosyl/UDP-glucosyltransferase [Macleaya cordata]